MVIANDLVETLGALAVNSKELSCVNVLILNKPNSCESNDMVGLHCIRLKVDPRKEVVEDLFIAYHPVSIHEKQKWCPSDSFDTVRYQLVIH